MSHGGHTVRGVRRGLAALLTLLFAGGTAAHAQVAPATLSTTRPITKLQAMSVPINRDNTAQAVTVSVPYLFAFMSAVPGQPKATATLRNVWSASEHADGKTQMVLGAGSSTWFAVGSVPAGYYHVRFDGTPTNGSSSATVEIHLGQNATDPLVTTCQITSSRPSCDIVVASPGGTIVLDEAVTNGQILFGDVYVAPTAKPIVP